MKKFLAALLSLVLVCSFAAMAEGSDAIEEFVLEPSYDYVDVEIADGLHVLVPADLEEVEGSDPTAYYFGNDAYTLKIQIITGLTFQEIAQQYTDAYDAGELSDIDAVNINGTNYITSVNADGSQSSLCCALGTDAVIGFTFIGDTSEMDGTEMQKEIAGSLYAD